VADFRAFLGVKDSCVLPYFGGTRVDTAERRLRVSGERELEPGWWKFRIEGRRAVPVEPASAAELDALPRLRGHWVDSWIVMDGRQLVRVALLPEDEPPALARTFGRRWYSGDVLFDALDFDDDAEVAARTALDEQRPLGELRGVVPSLRVAFGVALGSVIAGELGVPVSVRELVPRAVAIAERGRDGVREWLDELAAERQRAAEETRRRAEQLRLEAAAGTARELARDDDPVRRADEALDGAKARMLSCRRLERGTRLDVTYEVDGARILSIVDARTLQVIDPGVCLGHDGEYRVLTLDAMPSVVREAIETGRLNILRRA
jgi:hypothetical protein